MAKNCVMGCGKERSRRGLTCGDKECYYAFRYSKKQVAAAATQEILVEDEELKKLESTETTAGNQKTITLNKTRIKSLEELVETFKVDLQVWRVKRFTANKWEVGAKGDDKVIAVTELFQVKAEFERLPAVAFAKDELASLKQDFLERTEPTFPRLSRGSSGISFEPSGNLLELSIPDIHFGKLAWSKETGSESYDMKMAEGYFDNAFSALIERTSAFVFDEIVLVIGNDLFHVDNRSNTTTSGTIVDTDSRYYKVFQVVRRIITQKIEELREIAPVRVVVVPGNHDEHTSWHLGDSLECWFRGCEDVTIDNQPIGRKVYQWGEVMFMWLHGDKGKKIDYPLTMATEYRKMFGSTRFHEIHCGHIHTEVAIEKHGVMTRFLPSLSGTDYWHSINNFTGNKKAAVAYVWNKVEGLLATGCYTVPEGKK